MQENEIIVIKGRGLSKYIGEGPALISYEPITFFGGVDPYTGIIIEHNHPLRGRCISGKVLVFPYGKGSTVGAYILYQLSKLNKAPKAIINIEADHVTIVGCVISKIPLIDRLEINPFSVIDESSYIIVDGIKGLVRVIKNKKIF